MDDVYEYDTGEKKKKKEEEKSRSSEKEKTEICNELRALCSKYYMDDD